MPRLFKGTLAAAVAVTLTGCGYWDNVPVSPDSGSPNISTGPGSATGKGTGTRNTTGVRRCTSAMLKASVIEQDAGAGQRHATLVLHNEMWARCSTGGWVGLQLVGRTGAIYTTTIREGSPRTFVLQQDESAYERLHWAAVPADDETGARCEPTPTVLRVIVPNDTHQIVATWALGPVCRHGRIHLAPLSHTR